MGGNKQRPAKDVSTRTVASSRVVHPRLQFSNPWGAQCTQRGATTRISLPGWARGGKSQTLYCMVMCRALLLTMESHITCIGRRQHFSVLQCLRCQGRATALHTTKPDPPSPRSQMPRPPCTPTVPPPPGGAPFLKKQPGPSPPHGGKCQSRGCWRSRRHTPLSTGRRPRQPAGSRTPTVPCGSHCPTSAKGFQGGSFDCPFDGPLEKSHQLDSRSRGEVRDTGVPDWKKFPLNFFETPQIFLR